MNANAITRPLTPCGKKPPCAHRLVTDASGPPLPLVSRYAPRPIMPTMATTLMMANQNSASPKTFTFIRLMKLISRKKPAAVTQVGISGHQ
ncbi:hypothetical protein D3C80_1663060 [compost metagenome]